MKLKNVKLDMKVTVKDDWKTLSPNSIRLETITKSDFYTVIQTDEKEDLTGFGFNVKIKNHLNEFAWVSAMALKKHKPEELKQMLSQEEKEVFEGFGYAPQPLLEAIPNADFIYSTVPKYANLNKKDYMILSTTYGIIMLYDTKKKNLFYARKNIANENFLNIETSVLYNQKDEFDLEFAINLLKARTQGLDKEKKLRATKFKELYLPLESNHWIQITDDLVLYNLKTKKFIQVITDNYGNITFVQHIMQPNVNHGHEILVNRLPITQKFYISLNYVYARCTELNFEHMFAILESCIKIG